MADRVVRRLVTTYIPPQSYEDQWQVAALEQVLKDEFFILINIQQMIDEDHHLSAEDIQEKIAHMVVEHIQTQRTQVGNLGLELPKVNSGDFRFIWREHLAH